MVGCIVFSVVNCVQLSPLVPVHLPEVTQIIIVASSVVCALLRLLMLKCWSLRQGYNFVDWVEFHSLLANPAFVSRSVKKHLVFSEHQVPTICRLV